MEDKQIQTSLTEKIPEWKLKLAYFFTEHKILVKRAWVFSLFFIDLIIVFMLGSILINYQTGVIHDESQLAQLPLNLVNTKAVSRLAPDPLIFGEVESVQGEGGKYNLMSTVHNTNSEWTITELEYTFRLNGQDLEKRTTFVLPKSEKRLMYFNAPGTLGAELKILNTAWLRVRDFSLLSYKDGIEVQKATFIPSRSGSLSGEVEIELYNSTPYGFWEVGLPIVLFDQSSEPIAIDYIVINKLLAQEKRELSVNWHEPIARVVRKVGVFPEINLLDKGGLMPLGSPTGSPPGID